MLEARKSLIQQRRETAVKTKKQKDDINKLMESVRTDQSKANKIITMALKGNMTLNSIMTPERTSTGKKKKKVKRSKTSNSMLSSNGREKSSFSAGDAGQSRTMGDSMKFEMDDGHPNPQPYVSPYETTTPAKPQKVTL